MTRAKTNFIDLVSGKADNGRSESGRADNTNRPLAPDAKGGRRMRNTYSIAQFSAVSIKHFQTFACGGSR
jgi:hypothetical protein